MKQFIIILVIVSASCSNVYSQYKIDGILAEIEKNSTELSALRKKMEAEKFGNKTNIYLQNPEVEFNYLWGHPTSIGNRKDFSIKQTFDFPTSYSYRNQISDLKNEQLYLVYQKKMKNTLLKARLICVDLVYYNSLKFEFSKRLIQAKNNENAYKLRLDKGEANILEYNKSLLNLLNISSGLESVEIERNYLLSELILLNGGQIIELRDSTFELVSLNPDFEQWFASAEQNNLVLSWLKKDIKIKEATTKLNRAISLPKFQAGYMSENVIGQEFQGISVGMTIPLWENKNKLKFAKANIVASESIVVDNKLKFYNHLKALHSKIIGLQKNVNDYRKSLLLLDNSELLKKALEMGEISLIEYILELSIYYDSVNKLHELERDMNKSMAELKLYM